MSDESARGERPVSMACHSPFDRSTFSATTHHLRIHQLVSVLGARTVKRLILALAFLAATGIACGLHAASVHRNAVRLHHLAEDAYQHYDFASAHAHLVAYLELRPED